MPQEFRQHLLSTFSITEDICPPHSKKLHVASYLQWRGCDSGLTVIDSDRQWSTVVYSDVGGTVKLT